MSAWTLLSICQKDRPTDDEAILCVYFKKKKMRKNIDKQTTFHYILAPVYFTIVCCKETRLGGEIVFLE
jgi:hypothetical protein